MKTNQLLNIEISVVEFELIESALLSFLMDTTINIESNLQELNLGTVQRDIANTLEEIRGVVSALKIMSKVRNQAK